MAAGLKGLSVTPQTASKRAPFLASPLARRIGSAILGVIIAASLAMATARLSGQLHSAKAVMQVAFLWLMGFVALALLAPLWRGTRNVASVEANRLRAGHVPLAVITAQRGREAVEQFPIECERGFRKHFERVEVRRPWYRPWYPTATAMVLLLRRDRVSATLVRSRDARVDWQLMVIAGTPFPVDWLRGRGMRAKRANLRRTCREIHAVLTESASVSRVFWYARGMGESTAAVWTPDELPWTKS
jgi:hypothetical protein